MDAGVDPAISDDPVALRALLQYYQGCSKKQAEEILQLRGEIAILNARRAGCLCASSGAQTQQQQPVRPPVDINVPNAKGVSQPNPHVPQTPAAPQHQPQQAHPQPQHGPTATGLHTPPTAVAGKPLLPVNIRDTPISQKLAQLDADSDEEAPAERLLQKQVRQTHKLPRLREGERVQTEEGKTPARVTRLVFRAREERAALMSTFGPKSFQDKKRRRVAAFGDAGATSDERRRRRSAGPAGVSQPPPKKLRLTPQVGIPGRSNGCTPVSSPRALSSSISASDRMEEEEDVQEEDENEEESGMWDEYGYLSAVTVSPKPSRPPSPRHVDTPAIRRREKETRSTSAAEESQEQARASASVNAQVQGVTMPKVPVVSPDHPSGQPAGGHSSEHTTRAAGGNQWPMLDAAAPSQQQTTGGRVKYIMREFSRELSYSNDDDDDEYDYEEEDGDDDDDDDDDDEGDSFPSLARSKTPPFQRSSGPSPDNTPRRAGAPNHHASASQTAPQGSASDRAQMASSIVLPAVRTTRRPASFSASQPVPSSATPSNEGGARSAQTGEVTSTAPVSAAPTALAPSAAPVSSMPASSAPKPLQSTGSQARAKPPASAPGTSQGYGPSQSLKSAYPSQSVTPSRTKTVNTTSTPNSAPVPNVPSPPPAPPSSIHTKLERRVKPKVAGVKVNIAAPLMKEEAAYGRLGGCRAFDVVLDLKLRNLAVDRKFMASQFGGNSRRMFVKSARGAGNFLFPTLAMDPQLPLQPGQPGLLCRANLEHEWRAAPLKVFVGLRPAHFMYVGNYKLVPTTPLSADEYKAWTVSMKVKWASAIANKLKHRDIRVRIVKRRELGREPTDAELATARGPKSGKFKNVQVPEIIKAFEDGLETMHIWRMECVGFDVGLLRDIAQRLPRPRTRHVKGGRAGRGQPSTVPP